MIPSIEVSALFGPASAKRDSIDDAIHAAASGSGFMTITGFAGADRLTPSRRAGLLRVFALPAGEKAKLLRRNFDPSRENVYRGWFPIQTDAVSRKEGIDMGPDIARSARHEPDDPLLERTPLPPEHLLPGWRADVAAYFLAMETTGAALMRSVARGLGLDEATFDGAFDDGISTLRLTRYPALPPPNAADAHAGVGLRDVRPLIGAAHVDSGFVTLLAQDGVEGLQAQSTDGNWIDVPPADGTLAVNFGKLLERWTGGRIRATLHRVVSPGRERFSIPFFYEPRVDAEIAPLSLSNVEGFAPFLYGDYLWDAATRFVEQAGIRHFRQPRRPLG